MLIDGYNKFSSFLKKLFRPSNLDFHTGFLRSLHLVYIGHLDPSFYGEQYFDSLCFVNASQIDFQYRSLLNYGYNDSYAEYAFLFIDTPCSNYTMLS